MVRIVIFGNSGSGKSTLAKAYAKSASVPHLDLDDIAWKSPGVRQDIEVSLLTLSAFIASNDQWAIEGCYGSLIEAATQEAEEILFLNPGVAACQENCRSRPWEPHKYKSKEEQDQNLEMLLNWVADYASRTDEFSSQAHTRIFESFTGPKRELRTNAEARDEAKHLEPR